MRLFLDLDGVFANLDKKMSELFGILWHTDQAVWEELNQVAPNVFRDLEKMPEADRLLLEAKKWEEAGAKVQFLTALPRKIHMPYAAPGKVAWVREVLKSDWQVTFGPYASDKRYHCTGSNCVLVDDNKANIAQWSRKGGMAIHHTDELADYTLLQLRTIREDWHNALQKV